MRPLSAPLSLEQRLVRYAELRPCTTAFIDARTPGSERKENFTIIGPGVAENPDQYVHITEPHGFNIGGARQPPGCVNSQHSHQTAEVFVVLSGRWRFLSGERGKDGYTDLGPGDTISIPTGSFRGFANIGDDIGFMFAVLGGDDPGHVTWAPYVFESAKKYGLVLLQGGRLVDTAREALPPEAVPEAPTTDADVAKMRRLDSSALERCVARNAELTASGGLCQWPGFAERAVAGLANPAEKMPAGKMDWSHGFQVRSLVVAAGAKSPIHTRDDAEVLMVHRGRPCVITRGVELHLGPGDTLTLPIGMPRSIGNTGPSDAEIFVVRGADGPRPARLSP